MKREDLKNCAVCDQGLMTNGDMTFYKISFQRFVVDMIAVRELAGLEMMLGSPALASVMGPNRDIAKELGGDASVLVCETCANLKQVFISQMMETALDEYCSDEPESGQLAS